MEQFGGSYSGGGHDTNFLGDRCAGMLPYALWGLMWYSVFKQLAGNRHATQSQRKLCLNLPTRSGSVPSVQMYKYSNSIDMQKFQMLVAT